MTLEDFDLLLIRLHEVAETPDIDPALAVDLMLCMCEGTRHRVGQEAGEQPDPEPSAQIIPLFPSERRTHKSARRA